MSRHKKEALVQGLKDKFSQSEASFLIGYRGLDVPQMQKLRKGVREKGGSLKVAKARLMRLAAEDAPEGKDLIPFFKDQIGLVFVSQDMPGVLKFLYDFSQDNEAFSLVAGCAESKLIEKDVLTRMASLPSRDVLLAMVCGTLKAPLSKLAFVLGQIKEKKQ